MKNRLINVATLFLFVFLSFEAAYAIPTTVIPNDEGKKLHKVFAESDEAQLKRNPIFALFRGDMRYANRFGDFISDAYFEGEKQAALDNLKALESIT
ncbi:MAG: DUF885 domain-containing protein, partial [Pyrinomonadaceae bacterium]|nr:DUF885 domain-containing protein [Pyrinomonadaceae bacterium]